MIKYHLEIRKVEKCFDILVASVLAKLFSLVENPIHDTRLHTAPLILDRTNNIKGGN